MDVTQPAGYPRGMPLFYRFYPEHAIPADIGVEARRIPGVRWCEFAYKGPFGHFTAPDHAAPILARGLDTLGVRYRWALTVPPGFQGALGATPEQAWAWAGERLRSQVRAGVLDMLRPYQRGAIAQAATRDGLLLYHATAAGKALSLLLLALLRPGPVVYVTLASNTGQFAAEVARFTPLTPYVIRPELTPEERAKAAEREEDRRQRLTARKAAAEARIEKARAQLERAHDRRSRARKDSVRTAATQAAASAAAKVRAAEDVLLEILAEIGEDTPDEAAPAPSSAASLAEYRDACLAAGQRPFVIVGQESLPRWFNAITTTVGCTNLAVDEVHGLKAYRRATYVPAMEAGERGTMVSLGNRAAFIAKLSRWATYRYAGTATLTEDSTVDAWAPLDIVEPDAWGKTATAFRFRYCGAAPTGYEGALEDGPETTRPEELQARLGYCVHVVTKAMVEPFLPKNTRSVTWLGPHAVGPPPPDYGAALLRVGKQGKTAEREVHLWALSHMKDPAAILRILDRLARGQKVIVFCGRRQHVTSLHGKLLAALAAAGMTCDGWAVHGETPPNKRELVRQAFQAHEGPCFLLGTGDAWGTGLNIQRAHYLLNLHLDWSPGRIEQKEGRIHRPGGFDSETEYMFVENSAEAEIAARVFGKTKAIRQIGVDNLGSFREELLGIKNIESVLDRVGSWLATHEENAESDDEEVDGEQRDG